MRNNGKVSAGVREALEMAESCDGMYLTEGGRRIAKIKSLEIDNASGAEMAERGEK
jgi:hypothetical protein